MQYRKLGRSGLEVSRLIFGCMSLGAVWGPAKEDAGGFIRMAVEAGINTFDTANNYGRGLSEELLGAAIADMGVREDTVIATKVFMPMSDKPNGRGLGRKHVLASVDASLRRLKSDYIDLLQIHRLDDTTPVEETLDTFDGLIRSGKVRYIGASSMFAWQLMKLLATSDKLGLHRFISMQNHYNLLYREEEREMLPLCLEEGIGVMTWSPLARGMLARSAPTMRGQADTMSDEWYPPGEARDAIVKAVHEIAAERGVSAATVGLAWLLSRPAVVGPVIGVSKINHLQDALAAVELDLSPVELSRLETPYRPLAVAGISGRTR
jgi:aryl-alcohol dehydrogenase-like predicted oxidoreductase